MVDQTSSPTIRAGEASAGIAPASVGLAASVGFNLINGKIVPSVSGGALTIAIKTTAGLDPTPTKPVFVAFRDALGTSTLLSIIAAASLVISSGSTLSTDAAVPFNIWVLGFNDGGVFRVGAIKCTDVNRFAIYPINEDQPLSSTAEDGVGGADSAGVVYTNVAVTQKQFRILGSLEWSNGLAVPGTWDVNADIWHLHGIGMAKPGDVVQESPISNAATTLSNSTTIPLDGTPPQSSEGSAIGFWDTTITPRSLVNHLFYHAEISVSHHTGSCHMIASMFRDADASASLVNAIKIASADDLGTLVMSTILYPVDLLQRTYKLRVGGSAAGVWTVNGVNNGSFLGGLLRTTASVKEIRV